MRKNISLVQAGNEYLGHLEARGTEPGTLNNIAITLRQFRTDVCGAEGDILLTNITPKHADKWRTAHAWAPSTANRKLSEVRSMFKWCRARGYMGDIDPFVGWKNERVPDQQRLRIPLTDWDALLDSAPHPLERAILACGLFLMCRASELSPIQLKHLDLDNNEVEVYRKKTKRWDTLPICAELEVELRRWLTWYSERAPHALDGDCYLLPNRVRNHTLRDPRTGRLMRLDPEAPLNPREQATLLHRHVKLALRNAGYETLQQGGHTLRRSAARALYDELVEERGYDGALRRVQTMLDHKSSQTTELYLGLDVDKVTRNKSLRGKPMFASRVGADRSNVVALTRRDGTDG